MLSKTISKMVTTEYIVARSQNFFQIIWWDCEHNFEMRIKKNLISLQSHIFSFLFLNSNFIFGVECFFKSINLIKYNLIILFFTLKKLLMFTVSKTWVIFVVVI